MNSESLSNICFIEILLKKYKRKKAEDEIESLKVGERASERA